MKNKIIFLFIVIPFFFLSLYSCDKKDNFQETSTIQIGLYTDNGAASTVEVGKMLNELGFVYSKINKDTILTGKLGMYDLILFPGGDMWVYRTHLTSEGIQKIKEYLRLGGGYIGICAGSYFAANKIIWRGWADEPRQNISFTGLGIFSGTADGPVEDFAPTYQDMNCSVNITQDHSITADVPSQLDYLYSFGPKLIPNDNSGVSILGKTAKGDNIVALAFQYEEGRVFLSALHPEFDDDKTSWKMVSNAIIWCAEKK